MKKSKRQSPTCTENLQSYFSQFCGHTSIHGVQFLGEAGRFIIERLLWLVYITLVACCCIYLIMKTYNKWVTQPVMVTFATTETPIYKIPFPAVTICPQIKADPEKFNITDVVLKIYKHTPLSSSEAELFSQFALICSSDEDIPREELRYLQSQPYRNFLEVSLGDHFEDYIVDMKWLGNKNMSRASLANFMVFTSEGLCYSFNILPLKYILRNENEPTIIEGSAQPPEFDTLNEYLQWAISNSYASDNPSASVYPRRTFLAGPDGGLSLTLFTDSAKLNYLCGDNVHGFKVAIHNPNMLPDMDTYFHLPLDQSVSLGIMPKMIILGDELKSYTPQARKCYTSSEKTLAFYKAYSQKNCLNECLSNYTWAICNCRAFYMVGINNATPICGPERNECIQDSKVKFASNQKVFNDLGEELNTDTDAVVPDCDCLPSCLNLEYDVEVSQTQLAMEGYSILQEYDEDIKKMDLKRVHLSKLKVYFKEMQFMSAERHELYGYVDFFSNTGGLLGLFIGISVTSGVEILYFLTLRLACNIRKYGRRFWSGDQELIDAAEN